MRGTMARWAWALAAAGLIFAGCSDDATSGGGGKVDFDAGPDGGGLPTKDAALDSGSDAPGGGDAATTDPELPEWFGQPCDENADCEGGWCVQGQSGYVCTKTCTESCPDGYLCKGVTSLGPDVVFVCLPDVQRLCESCVDDQQCPLGGTCRAFSDGQYCVSVCDGGAECPVGYSCQDVGPEPGGEGARMRCVPDSGSCSCGAGEAGKVRSCQVTNAAGTCLGLQTCGGAEGWTACSAQTPQAEACDGVDNDCDGIIDNGLPTGLACENVVSGVGTCAGTQVCAGEDGWVCNAPQPSQEVCDYKDNDCDGQTDEGFTDASGNYTSDAHCGACNVSCAGAVANGSALCSTAKSPPQCVVAACDPGFLKLNDYQCVAGVSTVCQACSSDANCLFEGSKCLALADGKFCTQPCGSVDDCPGGYDCEAVAGAASKQCVPSTGSCSCDGTNLTLQRGCSKTFQGSATKPAYTCAGVEKCTPGGWASCELPADVCDGLDNDCDGVIDNGYLNPVTGKYTSDAHCGVCGNDCGNLAFANAVGQCDTAPAVPGCVMACKAGFFDVNDNPNDGCECQVTSATDFPGGADTNCDGVDGEVDNGVFVSKAGDDGAPGTVDMPMRTIQAALGRAAATGKRDVYVATGVYVESVSLQEGIGLYGGYSAEFDQRDAAVYETAIIGLTPTDALRGAVNGVSVGTGAKKTVLDGFTVFGANNPEPGGSSYAVYLRNVGPNLVVADNYVVAGDGGHGANGDVGSNGANGQPGAPGVAAQNTSGTSCTTSHHAAGGAGGAQTCGGVSTAGGVGGTRVCPNVAGIAEADFSAATQTPTATEHGKAGSNNDASQGAGGEAGWHNRVRNSCATCSSPSKHTTDGAHGTAGRPGQDGVGATACTNTQGYILNGHWNSYAGGDGKAGTAGGGGGGGGAGGGVDLPSGCTSNNKAVGGSGGGGGSGACGASGGKGGTGGGGSFGVFMTFATPPATLPLVYGNVIVRGRGGDGGDGGAGGLGGFGGAGGEGGSNSQGPGSPWVSICGNFGGWGGNGGNGGHGAGGAGGCGGVSYGFFVANAGANPNVATLLDNEYPTSGKAGSGGVGGSSYGAPGPVGATGAHATKNF